MGQRGPVSLAELVDRSVGIAGEIIDLLESDPPEIEAGPRTCQAAAGYAGKPPDRTAAEAPGSAPQPRKLFLGL